MTDPTSSLLSLALLGAALAATPGVDFALIVRNTLSDGRAAGYLTLAGNRAGFCVHLSLATAGLAAMLQASAPAFTAIRLAGAAYLAWLGIGKLRGLWPGTTSPRPADVPCGQTVRRDPDVVDDAPSASRGARATIGPPVRDGFLTNLLNPKPSLFLLALLPQLGHGSNPSASPWAAAGALLAGNTAWWVLLVALVGLPGVRGPLSRFQRVLDAAFGFGFVILGAGIVIAQALPGLAQRQ